MKVETSQSLRNTPKLQIKATADEDELQTEKDELIKYTSSPPICALLGVKIDEINERLTSN